MENYKQVKNKLDKSLHTTKGKLGASQSLKLEYRAELKVNASNFRWCAEIFNNEAKTIR